MRDEDDLGSNIGEKRMSDFQSIEERLRRLCLSFPGAYETNSFNHPDWRVGKKTFACFESYKGVWVINFKTTMLEQDELVRSSNEYFVSPYTGRYGWVCRTIGNLNWNEVARQIEASYRMLAPKREARKLDEQRSEGT